jgi:hypothetical protein
MDEKDIINKLPKKSDSKELSNNKSDNLKDTIPNQKK